MPRTTRRQDGAGVPLRLTVPDDTAQAPEPDDDRDCIAEYPAMEPGYVILFSIDSFGRKHEELRTPSSNIDHAMRYLRDGLNNLPRIPLVLN